LNLSFTRVEFPTGPPEKTLPYEVHDGRGLLLTKSEEEYVVGLRLMMLPQRDGRSVCAVLWDDGQADGKAVRVIFRAPPLYNFLIKAGRKFEPPEMSRRLVAAGFEYRQSASEYGIAPIKRVWRGELRDGLEEPFHDVPPVVTQAQVVTSRVQ
jgi:hypothetical protein